MSSLTIIPSPRHRSLYPGEFRITLGGQSMDGFKTSQPAAFEISVQHWSSERGMQAAGAEDCWRVFAKKGEPVLLSLQDAASLEVHAVALETLLGADTAAAVAEHLRAMLASFRSGDQCHTVTIRFDHPASYNEAIIRLAQTSSPGSAREAVLERLMKPWAGPRREFESQMAWYAANGPSEPGETQADYNAEVAAFRDLAEAHRGATILQLASASR
jgi:hypothetical protein